MRNEIVIRDDISVFKQGLSVQLFSWRAERPDEWTMDEFADKAADMEKEIATLQSELSEAKANEKKAFLWAIRRGSSFSDRHVTECWTDYTENYKPMKAAEKKA